jgi:hypothetical protein
VIASLMAGSVASLLVAASSSVAAHPKSNPSLSPVSLHPSDSRSVVDEAASSRSTCAPFEAPLLGCAFSLSATSDGRCAYNSRVQ